jgi:diguanylate cyclase (GGDEF)-like protein
MLTLRTFDSNIVSLAVLVIIYIDARNRLEIKFTLYNLFMALVKLNIALIVIDLVTWVFDGIPGFWSGLTVHSTNLLLFIMEPFASAFWVLYANYLVFHDDQRIARLKKQLSVPLLFNAALSIASLSTGWFFSINGQNIYQRGNFYWVHLLFCMVLMLYPFTFILKNRKKIPDKYFFSLITFLIPISIGTVLQVLYYGVTYLWTGMMLSLVIVYLTIQDRESSTDFLTEVYNRKQLDHFVKSKINGGRRQKPFSAILMDLDQFKEINDRYGHDVGDEALQDTVKVLRKCLRQNDFLARYGGDEFLVVLDIDDLPMLEMTIQRINSGFRTYNEENHKPFSLNVSLGYQVYDYQTAMTSEEFLKVLDTLMYQDKKESSERIFSEH